MVGPPPGIDWSCDWHVILHSWNDRVQRFTNLFHIKTWSRRCVEHYWKLGGYAANLPPERWISRVLAWNPLGRRRSGCPRTSWPSKFISYTRYRHLGNWQVLARDPDLWRGLMDDFCMFCGREWNAVVVCIILWCWFHLSHLRPNGLPTGVQVQSQNLAKTFFFDQHWLAFWKGFTPRVKSKGKQAGLYLLRGAKLYIRYMLISSKTREKHI